MARVKKKTIDELEQAARDPEGQGEGIEGLTARQAAVAAGERPAVQPVAVRAVTDTYAAAAANRRLPAGRLKPTEGRRNHWSADVEHGTTREDLERTEFWAHNTRPMKRRDHVEVWCEDDSFMAELVVLAVGPKDAKMFVKNFYDLDPIAPDALEIPSGYSVSWGGSIAKFRVQRGRDVVKEGFESRSAASRWLGNHLGSLAR